MAVAEAIDLEGLQEKWPAVVDQVRQGLGAPLDASSRSRARSRSTSRRPCVEVGFPAERRLQQAQGRGDRGQATGFTEAVRAIVGERLRPVYVMLEGEAAEAETISDDELIEKLKSEFDAEEFEVEDTRIAGEPTPGMDAALDAGMGGDET